MTRALEVLAPGPLTTVQDAGRPGQAALGIGRSGACDRRAHALANRLVGNEPGAAVLEVTFGALEVRARGDLLVATTGARCEGPWAHAAPTRLRDGEVLTRTFRSYRVPQMADVPPTEVLFADTVDGLGPRGAKSMSESPFNPVGAAMANALADATGVRFTAPPFTADRVWAVLAGKGDQE